MLVVVVMPQNLTTRTECEIFLLSREGFEELRTAYPTLGLFAVKVDDATI